jgi:hypothetical protein
VQPAGTPIHIDGRPAALRDGTAWLLPGPHELVLEGPAAATTKIVVTDRGEPGRVELAVVGPPSSPTVTTPVAGGDHAIWPAVVTWTGVGVGVVGGLVAGGSEFFLDEQLSGDGLDASERALGERAGQAGLVAAVAGVVVTAVGAGLSWSMP